VERTAIELAAASTRFGSPDDGLTAVAELRRRLDELEAWHVENAVRAGNSWSQIATALGVSKQAAHKKHASRLRTTARTAFATAARERGIVVTAEARRVVQHGVREARELGHARVGTGHLLLGLLREEHAASAALRSLEVSLGFVKRAIAPSKTRDESGPDGRIPISPQGRAALEQSLREAATRADRHLGVEHILLALLRDETGDAVTTLGRLGVTPREVEAELGRNVRPGA
jgi:ATP-dependent Clp protease ATP-binding subunit ClpA